jgi:hypothetical protein
MDTQEIADNIVNGNLRDARKAIWDAENPTTEALWVVLCLDEMYDIPMHRSVTNMIRLLTES